MQTILLLTSDNGLASELRPVLPKGHKLVVAGPRPVTEEDGKAFVFIDIDTIGVERIREYAATTFVIAFTGQERTGPVMEAATFGAYEIMHRPLRKDRIERVLAELAALRKEVQETVAIDKDVLAPAATCVIVGRSSLVMSLCEKVARIAQVEVPRWSRGDRDSASSLPKQSRSFPRGSANLSWPSTPQQCPTPCSSPSSSATSAGHSPAQSPRRRACSGPPTAGACSSTKWGSCRCRSKGSCCDFCKRSPSIPWGARRKCR